jgi:hypothetical protein
MSIFKLIILVITILIVSIYLSTISIRFVLLIFINIVIYYYIINDTILSSVLLASLEILEELFQPTLLSLSLLIFLGNFSFIKELNILYLFISSFQDNFLLGPVIVYFNTDTDK